MKKQIVKFILVALFWALFLTLCWIADAHCEGKLAFSSTALYGGLTIAAWYLDIKVMNRISE